MSYDEHLISMAGGDGDVLDQIQRRADKATEGPWHVDGFGDVVRAGLPTDYIDTAGITQDSEFIAHARTDIPALLAMVREQRAVIERVRELASEWDVVYEAFPAAAAGIFAKSHANRIRAALTATEATK